MTINIAVLGAGRIGQVHANAIASVPNASLIAISDPIAAAAQAISTRFGCAVRSIDEIAAADDIDAVAICTPTDTHADLIERFAHAGKAIFCEKPIDLDLARVQQCLSVVDQCQATLMLGFQRRFDPDFQHLKTAIDNGQIGAVETVTLTSRDPAPPPHEYVRHSGGIFRDMAIHDFDVARWLLQEKIDTVQAAASVLVDPEIGALGDFDTANILLKTISGKLCTIAVSRRAAYGYDQRIEVHGSKATIAANNHPKNTVQIAGAQGYQTSPLQDFFMSRYAAAYANEIEAFVDAVSNSTEPPTTGQDGLSALALAEAAQRSATENRLVRMDEIL